MRKTMSKHANNTPPPPAIPPTGTGALTNQQARAIAEKLFREHWATYHPLAVRLIGINYKRILERELKRSQVEHQMERAEVGGQKSEVSKGHRLATPHPL